MTRPQPAPLTASTPGIVRREAVPAPGIVHLGLGIFHRAHQAVYTDAAISAHGGDWGIIGVSSRSSAVTDAMHAQDMTYTVVEISPEGSTFSTPRVHSDAFVAAENPERVVAEIGAATTRIVSLTVTENGYTYSPATGSLNVADADVQHGRHTHTRVPHEACRRRNDDVFGLERHPTVAVQIGSEHADLSEPHFAD